MFHSIIIVCIFIELQCLKHVDATFVINEVWLQSQCTQYVIFRRRRGPGDYFFLHTSTLPCPVIISIMLLRCAIGLTSEHVITTLVVIRASLLTCHLPGFRIKKFNINMC
jgi:hypothetical protein